MATIGERLRKWWPWLIALTAILILAFLANPAVPDTLRALAVIGLNAYDDVRVTPYGLAGVDVSNMDLTYAGSIIPTLDFNEKTKWPVRMPKGYDPQAILEAAKNPGLGVRALHSQGITGEGVAVAIVDQPLYQDHPEFNGKIVMYKDFGCGSEPSMHGPAVASLLVGESCGTAPGAKVYYAAAPSWYGDAKYYADALDWIVSVSRDLPEGEKIRVVSVSAAPSGLGSPFRNGDAWDKAVANAEREGILVLDASDNHCMIDSCWYDPADPEDVEKCTPGYPGQLAHGRVGRLCAPSSPRTSAEEYVEGDCSYQYTGRGGLSWSIPYAAGVLALGWQVDPGLTSDEAVDLLRESAQGISSELTLDLLRESAHRRGLTARIIDPPAFVSLVRSRRDASGGPK